MTPATLRPPPAPRLPFPFRPEGEAVRECLAEVTHRLDWPAAVAVARPWVEAVRSHPAPFWALESLMREFPISSQEGLALMRLAEALLRVPDAETAVALTADQLGRADFDGPSADGDAPHRLLASLSASAIAWSRRFLPEGAAADEVGSGLSGLAGRLGARAVVAAAVRAIALLGRQFVLGRSIEEATRVADSQRRSQPTLRFSYDMLGEGARTEADAERYLAAYRRAVEALAGGRVAASPMQGDGISIKLSALFSRYEDAQRDRVLAELLPRVWALVEAAARANLNLTLDAEESDRLELSLEVFEAIAERIAGAFPAWAGFGLAVQAYQTRACAVVDEVAAIARRHGLRFMVRLVKGAYWDTEIKRAQEAGLPGYPVFTHKHHTDASYLACAKRMLDHADVIYSQFATHNAGTVAAIVQLARAGGVAFEFQRLHGMGEGVYREVMASLPDQPLRIYAPVGEHRDLLAYLVRRLLENGANSSFVHQLADEGLSVEGLLASPLHETANAGVPLPRDLFGPSRANSLGVELSCASMRRPLDEALAACQVPVVSDASPQTVQAAMTRLDAAFAAWDGRPLAERAALLRLAGDRLEARLPEFCALLVREAGKTMGDAVAEVREAVDFCRYYAALAEERLGDQALPGPTGESNTLRLRGRGVFVCISPWNFPLAIFAGQVVAALVAGNPVAAKPAEQTPAVALRFVELLHEAGVPRDVLALLCGPGETVGQSLVEHPAVAGVCFTGSTQVARSIHRTLALKDGPIVPLIAETGGLNAMIVDSTALAEQVADAVVQSAFRSAGQRCSALRLLLLHESVADGVLEMIAGAMRELRIGDPAELATDVGPLIDEPAARAVSAQVERLRTSARPIAETPLPPALRTDRRFVAPAAFEIGSVAELREEIFGPVLHVVRWSGDVGEVVRQVNALGYGLTLGVQTRIEGRARRVASAARVGNVYVNRNVIGAVVGVQPFGGEGLSGTGPKAGGPHYLYRFCSEQTVTVNTAAAGGNAELLAGLGALSGGAT